MTWTCVACRGAKDEAESLCQGCTEALTAIVTQEEEDHAGASSTDENPPPVQQQQQQHGELCPACRDPLPHPSLTLCPGCLEAARCCVCGDDDALVLWDGAVSSANDGHNHHYNSDPAAATSAATPRTRPVADAAIGEWTASPNGDAITTITVKSPGRLIRERFLAACAQGEVVELLLSQESPSASSSSSECVIVDVRPARSSNNPITRRRQVSQTTGSTAASSARQEPSTTNGAAQSKSTGNHDPCSHDEDDDNDECRIVGVKSNSEQIHERLRQAAASGQVINLMTTTTSMRQSNRGPQQQEQGAAATANNEMTKHRTTSMHNCSSRKRPAPVASSSSFARTNIRSNPQAGASPPKAAQDDYDRGWQGEPCRDCGLPCD